MLYLKRRLSIDEYDLMIIFEDEKIEKCFFFKFLAFIRDMLWVFGTSINKVFNLKSILKSILKKSFC